MARDLRAIEKLRQIAEDAWTEVQAKAVAELKAIQNDPLYDSIEWNKRSVRTAVNVKIAETIGVEARARNEARATKSAFVGVVVAVPRIESQQDWESMAKQVQQGKEIIDVPALPAIEEDDE